MSSLKPNEKIFLRNLALPLAAIIVLTIIGAILGLPILLVQILSWGATFAVLFGNFGYIVLVDSKRRWPNLSTSQRFARIMTFSR